MLIRCTNSHHRTETTMRSKQGCLTRQQVLSAARRLCGVPDCGCKCISKMFVNDVRVELQPLDERSYYIIDYINQTIMEG